MGKRAMRGPYTSSDLPTLDAWLEHAAQCHPQSIAMGLERVQQVYQALKLDWKSTTLITVAGTNGKGSSCAMLEAIYRYAGYRTALYTSPHLLHFEERLRLNGQISLAQDLLPHFEAVEQARYEAAQAISGPSNPLELSYFEFTTLALLRAIAHAQVDVAVLEVGLGGRLDAVNVIDAHAALITSIDLDHQAFLGATREAIGREKVGIARSGRPLIVSDPAPPASLLDTAQSMGVQLYLQSQDFGFEGDRQQWSCRVHEQVWGGLAYPALRGANQLLNASGVLATIYALRHERPVFAQAIRQGLAQVQWPGRFQVLPGTPVVVLDVAHNPHAVAALVQNLDAMGYFPCTHAVFGALADKDIPAMLAHSQSLIDHWYFTDLPMTPRAQTASACMAQLKALPNSRASGPAPAQIYSHPEQAFAQAQQAAASGDRIVVFGSFHTVGPIWGQLTADI
jgi:dihydrofolate synthase/folylpolyglutamate synthase